MLGFDTVEDLSARGQEILAGGYGCVGKYLRIDRTTPAEVAHLRSLGIAVFLVWEKGQPTSDAYFTADQGRFDGQQAASFASHIGAPAGTCLFAAYDYAPSMDAIVGILSDYALEYQKAVKSYGYLPGAYGCGSLLTHLKAGGLIHYTWLANAPNWPGTAEFLASGEADIVQLRSAALGLNSDVDEIHNEAVLWTPA